MDLRVPRQTFKATRTLAHQATVATNAVMQLAKLH